MKAIVSVLFCCCVANGQVSAADKAVQTACAATAAVTLPSDMKDRPRVTSYPSCGSYGLYDAKKFGAARRCAIEERVALLARVPGSPDDPHTISSDGDGPIPAGGLVVLSELYGNGEGVAQNPRLAARFFCEAIDTGEVEAATDVSQTKSILDMLGRLEALTPSSPRVVYCNHDSSMTPAADTPATQQCDAMDEDAHAAMHAGGIQAGEDSAQEDADNADDAIKPVLARLSATQRAAYRRAAAAMQHFIDVQATGDLLYMGGYGTGGLYPNEMHANFENLVVASVAKPPAIPSGANIATADRELNDVYRRLLAAVSPSQELVGRELNPENLRREQRAWLAYRDAFIAFGQTLDPRLPASAWLRVVTTARTDDLKEIVEMVK